MLCITIAIVSVEKTAGFTEAIIGSAVPADMPTDDRSTWSDMKNDNYSHINCVSNCSVWNVIAVCKDGSNINGIIKRWHHLYSHTMYRVNDDHFEKLEEYIYYYINVK